MALKLDHIAVVCRDLDTGCAWVEAQLGVTLQPGGQHAHYGTHNRLLRLGDGEYFEVIAPDPNAPTPPHPRWFNLDNAPEEPCVGNWLVRTDDMVADLATAPPEVGPAVPLSRDTLRWSTTVPTDGSLPFGGGWPTLLAWGDTPHPAGSLADAGVALTGLTITHPRADELAQDVLPKLNDSRITYQNGHQIALNATFSTPTGPKTL